MEPPVGWIYSFVVVVTYIMDSSHDGTHTKDDEHSVQSQLGVRWETKRVKRIKKVQK